MVNNIDAFLVYYSVRGIGRKEPFNFSIKHYVHYYTPDLIKLMIDTYAYTEQIKNIEYKQQIINMLFFASKTDIIPQLIERGESVPEIFYKIEKTYKKLRRRFGG